MNTDGSYGVTVSEGGESEDAAVDHPDLLWRDVEERENEDHAGNF